LLLQWQRALDFLDEMKRAGLKANIRTYNKLIQVRRAAALRCM
jgi:hypothetical protein